MSHEHYDATHVLSGRSYTYETKWHDISALILSIGNRDGVRDAPCNKNGRRWTHSRAKGVDLASFLAKACSNQKPFVNLPTAKRQSSVMPKLVLSTVSAGKRCIQDGSRVLWRGLITASPGLPRKTPCMTWSALGPH